MRDCLFFAFLMVAAGLRAQTHIDPGLPHGPYGREDPIAHELSVEGAARFLDKVATNW